MNKQVKQTLQTLFFFGLAVLLIVFQTNQLSDVQRQQVGVALREANYFWMALSMATAILAHYVRAIRWKLLINATGHSTSAANSFYAVMIGYLVNGIVPRLGEVVRCGALSRREKIPVEKLIGTVVTARIVDLIFMLIVVGATIVLQFDLISDFLNENIFSRIQAGWQSNSKSYLIGLAVVLLLATLGYFLLIQLVRRVSKTLSEKIQTIRKGLLDGMKAIFKLKEKGKFIGYSATMWVCYFFMSYFVFFSFSETARLGVSEGLSVLTTGSLGLLAPLPGGLGSYHYLVSENLQLYGISEAIGLSYSWLVWLAQFIIIIIVGLLSLFLISRTTKN